MATFSMNYFQDGEPCKVGVAMTDLATGLYAHGAIMAALLQRNQTGKGQKISCDLLSTQVSSLVNLGSNYLNGQLESNRWGTAHASIVPYQSFKTKDGYFTIGEFILIWLIQIPLLGYVLKEYVEVECLGLNFECLHQIFW